MKILDDYLALQEQIFDYFGYKEDWRVIPLDDQRSRYWILDEGRKVIYSDDPFTRENIEAGTIFSAEIYTQRHLPKWVYRGPEYTMVCADTHTDGNKFLMVFENAKECTDESLKELYNECW